MDNISPYNIKRLKYTMAILIPPADNITNLCQQAITRKTPFACLVPNTLIHLISQNNDGSINEKIQQQVDDCQKIVLLQPELTWCVFGISKMKTKTVFVNDMTDNQIQNEIDRYQIDMAELYKNLSENDPFPGTPIWGTRAEWIPRQDPVIHLYDQSKILTDDDGLRYYRENDDSPSRIIVPVEYQTPLIVWHHRHLCHMAPGKLWNHLRKRYHWHYMLASIKKIVNGCRLCNVLKKRHNLAHKHFRAKLEQTPRTSYGADFISVQKTKHGFTQILGIIDLSTGNLVLRALRHRDAKSTARVIYYDIITKKGVPMLFHSDVAGELLQGASKMLAILLGIKQTSTKGHNPQANAKMERVWAYVGNCLKTMTSDQYDNLHLYMDNMSHVWNTSPDSDTNLTPFEIEHGMKARSVTDSLMDVQPDEGLPADAEDIRTIVLSTKAFQKSLNYVKAIERTRSALLFNKEGKPIIQYNVGDKVVFYLPPSKHKIKVSRKKRKHILQWHGPATIVQRLSPSGTTWRIQYTGKFYERHIKHMDKWTGNNDMDIDISTSLIQMDSYVAYTTPQSLTHYHLAKIVDITNDIVTVWHMGTRNQHARSAVWKPFYIDPITTELTVVRPNNINATNYRLTSKIKLRQLSLLTQLPNVTLVRDKISHDALTTLNTLKLKHHVYRKTWQNHVLMTFTLS